jgi:hypothetical protein
MKEYKTVWDNMRKRCNPAYQEHYPQYAGVTVCTEWQHFHTFYLWMKKQPWQGNEIDKDIIMRGNKVYGPDGCRFVPHYVNTAMRPLIRKADQAYPLGVALLAGDAVRSKPYRASSLDTHRGNTYLGTFATVEGAHRAWQASKINSLQSVVDRYIMEPNFYPDVLRAILARQSQLEADVDGGRETTTL